MIDYNVFEGTKVTGLPRYTLSRGEVVFRDGKVQAELGRGKFVKREPFAADARALKNTKSSPPPPASRAKGSVQDERRVGFIAR